MHETIQGSEQKQLTGQLRLSQDIAIARHIAQFWNPRHHQEEDIEKLLLESKLEEALRSINEAQTIGEAKRAVQKSYSKGLRGTSYQGDIQRAVIARKSKIREQRKGFAGTESGYGMDKNW